MIFIEHKFTMKNKISVFIVAVLCATGCGAPFWSTMNQNQNKTSVVLSDNNFRVIKNVSAEVHCTYVFGIGGLSNRALMSNAISELTQKADLQGSQALINISVKTHNKLILVWSRRSMVAQGTVIEFIDKNNPNCSEGLLDNTRLVVGQNLVNENSADEEKFIVAGKSSFEQKQLARTYCLEILDDIENNQIDSAKSKFKEFEQIWNSLGLKDSTTEKYIKQIKQKLL